jgi:hypothetical protein
MERHGFQSQLQAINMDILAGKRLRDILRHIYQYSQEGTEKIMEMGS